MTPWRKLARIRRYTPEVTAQAWFHGAPVLSLAASAAAPTLPAWKINRLAYYLAARPPAISFFIFLLWPVLNREGFFAQKHTFFTNVI
jgi:hypothetical protein